MRGIESVDGGGILTPGAMTDGLASGRHITGLILPADCGLGILVPDTMSIRTRQHGA